ncbi:MAG: hypothetical protein E7389_01160 [Ruminococcaceae bacterium]|nr:hypothetical protein [Oscillospiraceae bacterium]
MFGQMAGGLIVFALALGSIILWQVFFGKLFLKVARKTGKSGLCFILFFLIAPIGTIIAAISKSDIRKQRDVTYNAIISNPSDQTVDDLIAYLQQHGCIDTPNAWHQLRGIWYAVNKSSNISTPKKDELQTFLMLKGLYLNSEERKIIDNCGK